MTVRYIARAVGGGWVADDDDGDIGVTAHQVIVEDDEPQPTGLFNANGLPLYRVRERHRMGFHINRETTAT